MPEELPAWCTWWIFSIVVYLSSAVASKPMVPIISNEGMSLDSDSTEVPGRMVSSWASIVRPLRSVTGTIERLKWPAAWAAAARRCDSAAKASRSARLKPSSVAIRSALTPCGTKDKALLTRGSMTQAPPSLPMGQRLIDSTPPATTMSSMPDMILAAARLTASRPEAQKRDRVTPATVSDQPASSTAVRAMSAPCSPTGVTQPSTTSSTSEVSR